MCGLVKGPYDSQKFLCKVCAYDLPLALKIGSLKNTAAEIP